MSELTEQIRATCDSIAGNQKKVYDLGFEQGKKLGGYSEGFEAGKQAQYDELWDMLQNYGNRTNYTNAFKESGFEYFHPKYKVIPTSTEGGLSNVFMYCRKLKKLESKYIDFSQAPRGTFASNGMYYTFASCHALEEVEDIGLSPSFSYTYTFAYSGILHTIARITVDENTRFDNAFLNCHSLVNLNVEGTIGQNGFDVISCTKLSKASWISIMTSASTTASITITGSLVSVNKAFETSEGANDGSTSPEWLALKAARPTVSISLI